jgi:tetratricopeptide (TPR) repeat protein
MARLPFFLFIAILSLVLSSLPALAAIEDCDKAAKLSDEASILVSSNPALASNKLRMAISYCNKSAALYYNRAMALYQQGKPDEAESNIEESLKLNPDYAKALNGLAFLQFTKHNGDKKRAETMARKAVTLEPKNEQYRNTLELIIFNVDTPPKTQMSRPDAIAIIIGNKSYSNSSLPQVKFADKDAAVMKQYLIDALGYDESNIILIKDATHIDFVKYFGDPSDYKGILYNRARKDRSDIFIYYVGHGAPDTNTHKAYLVPADADPTIIKLTGYSLDTLYENLSKVNNDKNLKSITIVLDSCFSGGSNDGMIIQDASPIFIETSSPVFSMKNTVIFSSSRGNQISSWYPEKRHSLFTYFFLKNLKDAIEQGKNMTAGDLEKALLGSNGVNDFAWRLYNREQEPQVIGDKNIVLVQ